MKAFIFLRTRPAKRAKPEGLKGSGWVEPARSLKGKFPSREKLVPNFSKKNLSK
jgi:hypothetical protein